MDEGLRDVFRDAGFNTGGEAGRALLTAVMVWARVQHETSARRIVARTKVFLWLWGGLGGVILVVITGLVQKWLKL